MAEKNKGGRPPKWSDDDAPKLAKAIEAFFAKRDADKKPYTVNGLTLAIDLVSKATLYEMRDNAARPAVSKLIKGALLRIEDMHECNLAGGRPVGSIFALKNATDAGGWKDKQEVETKHSGAITVVTGVPGPLAD